MLGEGENAYRFHSNRRKPEFSSSLSQKYPVNQTTDKREYTGSFNSKPNAHYDDSYRNTFSANKNSAGFGNRGYSSSQPDSRMMHTSRADEGRSNQSKEFKTASEELVSTNSKLLLVIWMIVATW